MLVVSLDQYIVVVALPEIGRDRGFSEHTLQSVVGTYAVASAGFLLFGGCAADVVGRRRVLVAGLALYASASLLGATASSSGLLLAARAIQGVGGALVFPATLSLVNTTFAEGPERNRAVAVWGAAGAAGLVIGVLLGGVLTHGFGWETVFLVNVPLAVVLIALGSGSFPRISSTRETATSTSRVRSPPRLDSRPSCLRWSRVPLADGVRRRSSSPRARASRRWSPSSS
jgi:MFS family permease